MSCVSILDNDSTLVSPPSFAQNFDCAIRSYTHNAGARSTLNFLPNGTWTLGNEVLFPNLFVATGSWHVGVPANPADFEIRFTGTVHKIIETQGNNPTPGMECNELPYQETYTPEDSGWQPLNVARAEFITASAIATGRCGQQDTYVDFPFTIQIRQISNNSNAVSGSGTLCAEANAQAN